MPRDKTVNIRLKDLIYPLFVKNGKDIREEIPSMPGVYRFSPDTLIREARELVKLGIRAVLIFGLPEKKDSAGSKAYEENNIAARAVKALKLIFRT